MRTALLSFTLLINAFLMAQETDAYWDSYIAVYENQLPGSTTLNMSLIDRAPLDGFPYVVVTGLTYSSARSDGFPESGTLDMLYTLQDQLLTLLSDFGEHEHVGSFTHNRERLEYFYLSDSIGVSEALQTFYTTTYPDHKNYINVEDDPVWSYYREFLYPNPQTRAYMSDQAVIRQLAAAGDPLTKRRRVDHWLHFTTSTDMKHCAKELKSKGFTVQAMKSDAPGQWAHTLQVWRTDMVNIETIYPLTTELRKISAKYNGDYDGWETSIEN